MERITPGPCKTCKRIAFNGEQCIECWTAENVAHFDIEGLLKDI